MDVALGGLDAEAVDALRLLGGAEREARQHLGLAAGEQAGAVDARQHADLGGDRPDLVGGAAVGALLVDRDAAADDALLERVEGAAEGRRCPPGPGRRRGRPRRRRRGRRRSCRAAAAWPARGWPRRGPCRRPSRSRPGPSRPRRAARRPTWACPPPSASSSCAAQRVRISSWAIWRASSIVSSSTSLAPASTIEMASAVPATTRSSSDSSVSWSVGLMMNSSPIRPMRTAPTGPGERHLGEHQRRRGAVERQDVEGVDLIHGEDRRDDLGLVAVALGPQRPDRPVGHARGEGRAVARARLALDEAAGDLARGVHALLDVHREGEEVGPRPRRLRADGGDEDDRVPRADEHRAVGLLGQLAGLERDRRIADLRGNDLYCHVTSLVCPAPLGRSASLPAPPWCRAVSSSSFCRSCPARDYLRRPSVFVSSRYPSRSVRCM